MWIRSQDRKALLNVNQVLISPSVDGSIYYINDSLGKESNVLGVYSSKEKAKKVLDEIQKSKDGVETEIKKQISFHSTLEGALQSYSNN